MNSNDETVAEANPKRHRRKVSPRFLVHVTDVLIETALPKDSGHCMVADAVKIAFPTARRVSVDLQTIRFSDPEKGLRYVYLTHGLAQAALINFDEGIHPRPFQFEIGRAVQIFTMYKRPNPKGKPRPASTPVHDLGPKRWQPESGGMVGTIIGGPPLPTMRENGRAEHDSSASAPLPDTAADEKKSRRLRRPSRRREFGLRLHKTGADILIGGGAA